ncbi:MAG: GDYXXLXY domain-containing protein [Bacteroidota bacterium]
MNYKKLSVAAFMLTCLAQLYVPGKMILDREDVLKTGIEYKFRTEPVDPNDPFRGKYIVLGFQDNTFEVPANSEIDDRSTVYLQFENDAEGFAQIKDVMLSAPPHDDFLMTTVLYSTTTMKTGKKKLNIYYPFDRYYMEEYKAPQAEETYREANRDTSSVTYALVNIKNGEAVLKDVVINEESIKDIVEGRMKNEK